MNQSGPLGHLRSYATNNSTSAREGGQSTLQQASSGHRLPPKARTAVITDTYTLSARHSSKNFKYTDLFILSCSESHFINGETEGCSTVTRPKVIPAFGATLHIKNAWFLMQGLVLEAQNASASSLTRLWNALSA